MMMANRQYGRAQRTGLRIRKLEASTVRAIASQFAVFAAIAAVGAYLGANLLDNLAQRSIHTGFAFLAQSAGFNIGASLVPFSSSDTYARALLVGLANTLVVAACGILLSTTFGTIVGIARLSRNPLVGSFAGAYVEAVRNVPLLLQLFLWYAIMTEALPPARAALRLLPGVFLSKNGLDLPLLVHASATVYVIPAAAVGGIVAWRLSRRYRAYRRLATIFVPIMVVGVTVLACALAWGMPKLEMPVWHRFRFEGGAELPPEFLALVIGLSAYNTAFIAEIVRSGIQSVGRGQRDAAAALGLRYGQVLRFIILPQAKRVIVPPLGTQYLNLTKNSSLAVAIGYPDLMSIADTTLNQTGQAIEVISLIMAVYLLLSLMIALGMNAYNARDARWGSVT